MKSDATNSVTVPEADLIVDLNPESGTFNMAMDAALLELASHRTRSVVRIYRWQQPTVTTGYFQRRDLDIAPALKNLPAVRRLSGGGAILHDRELTYSCILPPAHPARHNPSGLYVAVHQSIIRLFRDCGLNCMLRSDYDSSLPSESSSPTEPFLCFLRQNPNDIVHSSGTKLVGSAQRRRQGVILQHGSILLAASPHTPQVPGAKELSGGFDQATFAAHLPEVIAASIASIWRQRQYLPEEKDAAARIQSEQAIRETPAGPDE